MNTTTNEVYFCNGCAVARVSALGILCDDCTAYGTPPVPAPVAPENATANHKPSRSYTKRVEIGGKCVLVTLHDDRLELRERYGRSRAEFALERIWDAAEGRLC